MIKAIPPTIPAANFWRKVDVVDPWECWQWLGAIHNTGYGTFSHRQKKYVAHRVAYVLLCGEVPDGLVLDHLCRNRQCCNPHHLEPVTPAVNIQRGETGRHKGHRRRVVIDGITYCANWHPVEGANRSVVTDRRRKYDRVACLACVRMWNARYRDAA